MSQKPSRAARWWTYQRERFPLLAHGPLVAAFSLSALLYSAVLRGRDELPGPLTMMAAFTSALLFFLLLRIADEFKDAEDDRTHRPYRAVPRGLVTLRELAALGALCAALQLALALAVSAALLLPLLALWGYFALMCIEFGVPERLRRRHLLYLVSHMLIVPLLAFYVTAFDWGPQGVLPPAELGWFLLASFFSGAAVEVGRKLRAPGDEEPGVDTYTRLWGRRTAVAVWLGAVGGSATSVAMAAYCVGFAQPVLVGGALLFASALLLSGRFVRRPVRAHAHALEVFSGVWTLLVYGALGLFSLL